MMTEVSDSGLATHTAASELKIGTHCVHVSTAMGKLIRNNQVQVAEVLSLYAKGTGQQGVC